MDLIADLCRVELLELCNESIMTSFAVNSITWFVFQSTLVDLTPSELNSCSMERGDKSHPFRLTEC